MGLVEKLNSELPSNKDALSFSMRLQFLSQRKLSTKEVTKSDTDAETAVSLGHGVCQDHVHIFLSLVQKSFPCYERVFDDFEYC